MAPSLRGNRWICAGIFLAGAAITLGWAAYTGHVWEDFFITYRASKNLALGHGLVYTVGDRLQTFTSPLQALVPAAIAWATSCRSDLLVIWIYRAIGAGCFGGAVVLLWSMAGRLRLPLAGALACAGLILVDEKSIDFTASGMETPYLLLFIALQAYAAFTDSGPTLLGLAWAGMMWSRPDSFIQIGALAGALLLYSPDAADRRRLLAKFTRAAVIAGLLYLPWFAWAWWYYGSPVPNTIVAKGLHSPTGFSAILGAIIEAPQKILNGVFQTNLFGPTYVEMGPISEWGFLCHSVWRLLVVPVWCYWLNPWGGRAARTASLWLFIGSIYNCIVPAAPWYLPPFELVAAVAWGFLIGDLMDRISAEPAGARLPRAPAMQLLVPGLACLAVLFQAGVTAHLAPVVRAQQAIIEGQNRRPIGEWLRANAKPTDTVFLEPLGYIGYYSGLKTYDFPGLSSREVVNVRRAPGGGYEFIRVIRALKPDWLVLRPSEVEPIHDKDPSLVDGHSAGSYRLVRAYDQGDQLAALGAPAGISPLLFDSVFLIYHRTP